MEKSVYEQVVEQRSVRENGFALYPGRLFCGGNLVGRLFRSADGSGCSD
jgi:hypothetical protein